MKNFTNRITLSCLFAILALLMLFNTLNAQDTKFRDQAWRYGMNVAIQFNSLSLGYQNLHEPYPDFTSGQYKKDNSDGKGLGIYGGFFGEYLSDSWWGLQLRVSYDVRDGLIKDTTTGPPSGRLIGSAYDAKMNYISWELFFRADQKLIPNLSIYAGPILAANIHGTFDYKADMNGPVTDPGVKIQNRNIISYGVSGGLAYDIEVTRSNKTSFFLSPFAEASWIVNQRKSDYPLLQNSVTDVWSTSSFRLGVRASFECRNPAEGRITEVVYIPGPEKIVEVPVAKKFFLVMPNDNKITTKNINGYYPILPYVFFEKGNKEIPSRYIILSKVDAQNFNETDLGDFTKGDMTVKQTNVNQLIITYYNVMNIYGGRMKNNPNEQVTLRASDPDEKDGEVCAQKVKNYLVNNFGINANRIKIVVESPKKPSGSAYTDPAFASLLDEENRRVDFIFSNEDMYKPIPYTIKDESSIDNDMIVYIDKDVPFKTWDVTFTGDGKNIYYGPFKGNSARINASELMRSRESGSFNAKFVITDQNGKKTEENANFSLSKDKESKNASRYLMLFDYNKSEPILSYETKIKKEIVPGMSKANVVIIHGHTDIIGNEEGNQKLSQERAEQAKSIIDAELGREKRKVEVQAVGIGQTNVPYTFNNKYPEGRMYNRNVFIESTPGNYGVK